MRDIEVVESIVAGDSGGLAAAYDEYADLIYAYCRTMLSDPDDAADAVQATFVIAASHSSRLRDPSQLRAWLFAIARNQCLRVGPQALAGEPGMGLVSAEIGSDAERSLLRSATDGLDSDERDVITLLWHGLDVTEAALVLGVSRNHLYSVFSRARDQLETSVAVLLVGRYGRDRGGCPQLREQLLDWNGSMTVRLRDQVSRHIEACETCSRLRDQELRPALLLSLTPGALLGAAEEARAATPPAPAWLRDKLLWLVTTDDPDAGAERRAMGRHAGPFGHTGFPRPRRASTSWIPQPGRPRFVIGAVLSAAAAAVVVAVVATSGQTPSAVDVAAGQPSTAAIPSSGLGTAVPGGTAPSASPGSTASVSPSSLAGSAKASHPAAPLTQLSSAPASTGSPPTISSGGGGPASSHGNLLVSPSSISVVAPFSAYLTLTAQRGTVKWSVIVPSSMAGELSVSPSSGTLSAGQSVSVRVWSTSANSYKTTLTANPGGHQVAVTVGLG
jgi:RNA polymerase sigma factor (sigma-70 family)